MASALALGLLVLGPHLSRWVGNAIGNKIVDEIVWWTVAEWPILVGGLLLAFAVIYYLGPNVEHPKWSFLSFGAVFAVLVWLDRVGRRSRSTRAASAPTTRRGARSRPSS